MKILNIKYNLDHSNNHTEINLNDTQLLNKKYLLNTNKSHFTNIEKIVYDIANYHCINNSKNIQDLFIEFYFEKPKNNINFQVKKNNELFLSTVTLLDSTFKNDIDTNGNILFESILTNISYNDYKYKLYDDFDIFLKQNFNKLSIAYLSKNMQLVYNSTNIIFNLITDENPGENIDNTTILYVNLWMKNIDIDVFTPHCNSTIQNDTNNNNVSSLIFSDSNFVENSQISIKDNINSNFYENILYKKDFNDILFFLKPFYENGSIIKKGVLEIIDLYDKNESINIILKEKFGNLRTDINEINNTALTVNNRFLQRFHHNNIIDGDICDWIINEAEKYSFNNGWTTTNFENYKTMDIKIEKLMNVFNFFLSINLKKIVHLINKDYCLPENTNINVKDLNIIKYQKGLTTGLDFHEDAGFLTFNICLSDNNDYDGGGTLFEDGLIMKIGKGEMIVHAGCVKHKGINITRGKRYIIVGIIDITINVDL